MASPDASVIIPVYNAMPYLTASMESVIGQSLGLDRFEIIAVDDGSTDGSGEELERLAEACPAMRVLHQENSGGPSAPRNVGLDHATGRYIFFFDADDRMAPEAMERMLGLADEQSSDIVIGKPEGTGGRHSPQTMFTHNQPRADLFDSHIYRVLNVIKLFRREFLEQNDLRFREDLLTGEDQPFTAIAYLNADVISVLADYTCFYWHFREDGGNSTVARGDLASRMVAPRTMFPLVAENVEPGPRRDWLMHRHFDLDLRVELGAIPGETSREEQLKAVREIKGWLDAYYTDAIDARMSAFHRVCFDLIRRDLFDELIEVLVFERSDAMPATLVENGRVFVRYPFFRDPDIGVPDQCFDETDRVRAVSHLDSADWDGGLLRVGGHARLTHVDSCGSEIQLVLKERGSGEERVFAAHPTSPKSQHGSAEGRGPRDTGEAWEAEIDLCTAADRPPLRRGLWDVYARVSHQSTQRDGRLGPPGLEMAGVKDRPRIVQTSTEHAEILYTYYTEPYGNLSINVGDIGDNVGHLFNVDGAAWSAQGAATLIVSGQAHVSNLPSDALTLCAIGPEADAHCVVCQLDPASPDGRFTGRLELARAAEGKALSPGTYSLEVRLAAASIAESDVVPRSPDLTTLRWWKSGVPYHARPSGGDDAPLGLVISRIRLGRAIKRRLRLGAGPKQTRTPNSDQP